MPLLVQNSKSDFDHGVLSISNKYLITKDTSAQRLWNVIDMQINLLSTNYNSLMLNKSTIVFKYRTIYIKQEKIHKISRSLFSKKTKLNKLDIVDLHGIKYNNKILTGKIIPLTMNLNYFEN